MLRPTIEWTDEKDGCTYHQHRKVYRIRSCPGSSATTHYLVFVNKTREKSGKEVLRDVEQFVKHDLGGKELGLQDASFIACNNKTNYDLAFKHLLKHGKTWYESQGYRIDRIATGNNAFKSTAAVQDARKKVADAIKEYANFPVHKLSAAIRKQANALRAEGSQYTMVPRSLQNSLIAVRQSQENQAIDVAAKRRVQRARERLARMLAVPSKNEDAKLGPWLCSLSCGEYAFFMEAMYGDRYGEEPRWAVAHVSPGTTGAAKIHTPTLNLFRKGNALHVMTGRVHWSKKL